MGYHSNKYHNTLWSQKSQIILVDQNSISSNVLLIGGLINNHGYQSSFTNILLRGLKRDISLLTSPFHTHCKLDLTKNLHYMLQDVFIAH